MSMVPQKLLKMTLPSLLRAIAAMPGTRFSLTAAPNTSSSRAAMGEEASQEPFDGARGSSCLGRAPTLTASKARRDLVQCMMYVDRMAVVMSCQVLDRAPENNKTILYSQCPAHIVIVTDKNPKTPRR
jgi:hypothetical protein